MASTDWCRYHRGTMTCDVAVCTAAAVDDARSIVLIYDEHDEIEYEFDTPIHLCAEHRATPEELRDLSLSVLKAVGEAGHAHARFPRAVRVHYALGGDAGYVLSAKGSA